MVITVELRSAVSLGLPRNFSDIVTGFRMSIIEEMSGRALTPPGSKFEFEKALWCRQHIMMHHAFMTDNFIFNSW